MVCSGWSEWHPRTRGVEAIAEMPGRIGARMGEARDASDSIDEMLCNKGGIVGRVPPIV